MRTSRIGFAVMGAALLAACKDAPPRPAGSSPTPASAEARDSSRAAPDRYVGPSGGRMRSPPRPPAGTVEARPPDEIGDEAPRREPSAEGRRDRRDRRDRGDRPSREERVGEFDLDGDGKLSESEREAMRAGRAQQRMSRVDHDGDGRISPSELQGAKQYTGIDFNRADANRDGFLSSEELDAAMRDRRTQRSGDGERRRIRFRDGTNPDGDGGVTR